LTIEYSTPGVYPVYQNPPNNDAYYVDETANDDSYYPANANAGVLADQQGNTASYNDSTAGQDIYYYQSYVYDKAGNFSVADTINHNDRGSATGYFLGDFDNNGSIGMVDLTPFSQAFGKDHNYEHWEDEASAGVNYMDCDIGPTGATQTRGNDNRFGLPKTDGIVNFEDLMIFAMNFANVPPSPPAPVYEPTVFPENTPLVSLSSNTGKVDTNEIFSVSLRLSSELRAKGAHLILNYDSRYFEVIKVSEGNLGLIFFRAEDKGGVVDINVAALGGDIPLADENLAVVEFRAKGSAPEAVMYLSKIDVRG